MFFPQLIILIFSKFTTFLQNIWTHTISDHIILQSSTINKKFSSNFFKNWKSKLFSNNHQLSIKIFHNHQALIKQLALTWWGRGDSPCPDTPAKLSVAWWSRWEVKMKTGGGCDKGEGYAVSKGARGSCLMAMGNGNDGTWQWWRVGD